MEEKTSEILQEQDLNASIDKLRDILNEMCCTIDEREVNMEKLNVSHQLDMLIVKYMGLKK
ncbi:hypothetical protein [Clostridium sp.]